MFPVGNPSVVMTVSRDELTALRQLFRDLRAGDAHGSLMPALHQLQERLEVLTQPR
jgi:hypothetical protein